MKMRNFLPLLASGTLIAALAAVASLGCSRSATRPSGERLPSRSQDAASRRQVLAADDVKTARFRRDPSSAIHTRSHLRPVKPGGDRVTTWKRSSLCPNTSRLMIGDKEDLPLKALQATVKVDGFRARVLLDLYYHNPHRRQYEGTFKLRLPEGASPYFLAFGDTSYRARDVAAGRAGP